MRRVALFALGLCLAFVPSARGDEWTKTFNITGRPDLRVVTSDASIHVDAWDQKTIEARVTTESYKIGEGGIRVYDHQSGDSVELEVRFPHQILGFNVGHRRVEVEIRVPREGRVHLRTGDGSIQVSGCKGDLELETGDGHQEIAAVDGTLKAHAGDGHIRAEGRFDSLVISTGDGRIEARALPGSSVNSSWDLHAGDGSIDLQVPENLAADVALHTSDGHISVDLPVMVEGRLGGNSVQGKLNGGGRLLTIRTGDGSIRLGKS